MSLPDAHWLSLNPRLEGLLLPSKFYGIAAAGRPMIFIGDPNGEVARLLRQHGCGVAIPPGDAEALVNIVQQWANDPAVMAAMGAKARAMLEAHYSRRHGLERWRVLLDKVAYADSQAASSSP